MAVTIEELKKVVYDTPLSSEEVELINDSEKFIDEEIRRQYKGGNSVRVILENFKFTSNYKFIDPRKKKMSEEQPLSGHFEDVVNYVVPEL